MDIARLLVLMLCAIVNVDMLEFTDGVILSVLAARRLHTTIARKDIDSAAKYIRAVAATVGIAGSGAGQDTWGSFSLSLVDALDTLLIMGNHTEFKRAVSLVLKSVRTDANVNVSVFETNIRVVGGLLSAHILSSRVPGMDLPPGWPCEGPLLDLAQKMADRLLPAFNTDTGMPYGTVNLKYGVHKSETDVTCTAGVGTFIVEFGALSRLTGDNVYERVALRAMEALWKKKSHIGLVGNHINVQNGQWTAMDAGIGAGVDSYFEYLVKGALLFQRPELMRQFNAYAKSLNRWSRKEDWFMWVGMHQGTVTLPIFQSLEAFWPGVLTMIGDIEDASRIMLQYSQTVRQYGFPPEFYNIPNAEADKRAAYPLRPEMAESLMYLYRATEDPIWLEIGAQLVDAIEHSAKTACGYATVNNVADHSIEDRMESFFLAETVKYLYLLFDPENFIHNDGTRARLVQTPKGECVVEAGGYIFNTEAHPVDPGVLHCCSTQRQKEQDTLKKWETQANFVHLLKRKDVLKTPQDDFSDFEDEDEEYESKRTFMDSDDDDEDEDEQESDFPNRTTNTAKFTKWTHQITKEAIFNILLGSNTVDMCDDSEKPKIEDSYNNEMPEPIRELSGDVPDNLLAHSVSTRWKDLRSIEPLGFSLLTSPQVPFRTKFQGMGQVALKFNDTWYC